MKREYLGVYVDLINLSEDVMSVSEPFDDGEIGIGEMELDEDMFP